MMKSFTAFAQNVGLVRFPNVKSRYVATVAGLILLHLRCFPKRAALVASMPLPVPGGARHVRFETGAAAGIQTPSKVNLADNGNLVIGAFAVIPSAVSGFYDEFPDGVRIVLESGITAASVAAILLNLLFQFVGAREEWRPTSATAGAAPTSSARKRFSEGSYGGNGAEENERRGSVQPRPGRVHREVRVAVRALALGRRRGVARAPLRRPLRDARGVRDNRARRPPRTPAGAHPGPPGPCGEGGGRGRAHPRVDARAGLRWPRPALARGV